VASKIRNLLLALPLALAGCGTQAPAPAPTSGTSGGAVTAPDAGGGFTIYEGGGEHDACGIGILVRFVPGAAGAGDAILLGGPAGHVPDQVPSAGPLPDNAARAVAGDPVTVAGKRFLVNAIDPAGRRVQLEPRC
jgi:hypothetical protein